MKTKKRTKIIFVCTGNTCRSPMAEMLLKKKLKALKLTGAKAYSAGLQATPGSPMNDKAAQTLKNKGIRAIKFASKQLDEKLVKESLAIICMTDKQRDIVMDMRWTALRKDCVKDIENNVYSFSDIVGYQVMDPYGQDLDCYEYVFGLLEGGMSALIDKILPEEIRAEYVTKPRKPKEKPQEKAEQISLF